jgi:hypothetical protein
MNAPSILIKVFRLKYQLDLAPPEDCAFIQSQIDEQLGILQCITKVQISSLQRVINKKYPLWLDGKYPGQIETSGPDEIEEGKT